jgi:hypothetical protein
VTKEAAVRLAQLSPRRCVVAPSSPSAPPSTDPLDVSSIVELEPWTAIATPTLNDVDGHFIPDFTAYLLSTVKLLIINIHSPEACAIAGLEKRKRELGIFSHRGAQLHSSHAPSFRDPYDGIRQSTSTSSILDLSAVPVESEDPIETDPPLVIDSLPPLDDSPNPPTILDSPDSSST